MTTLMVYLEATKHGVRPACSLALCLARDLGSEKGASVVALAQPSSPKKDAMVLHEASRRGADRLIFCQGESARNLMTTLAPRCLLGPANAHAIAVMHDMAGISPQGSGPVYCWVQGPPDRAQEMTGIVALVAGALPWYDLRGELVPEYPQQSIEHLETSTDEVLANGPLKDPTLVYADPMGVRSAQVQAELSLLGAQPFAPNDLVASNAVRICLGTKLLPRQGPDERWMLVPGKDAETLDPAWGEADWVLAGDMYDAVRTLHSRIWRDHLRTREL